MEYYFDYSRTCTDVKEPIGICDELYVIDDDNIDCYPLSSSIQVSPLITTLTVTPTTTTIHYISTTIVFQCDIATRTITTTATITMPTTYTATTIYTTTEKSSPTIYDYIPWIAACSVLTLIAIALLIALLKNKPSL